MFLFSKEFKKSEQDYCYIPFSVSVLIILRIFEICVIHALWNELRVVTYYWYSTLAL